MTWAHERLRRLFNVDIERYSAWAGLPGLQRYPFSGPRAGPDRKQGCSADTQVREISRSTHVAAALVEVAGGRLT
jgi:hypothetical protein